MKVNHGKIFHGDLEVAGRTAEQAILNSLKMKGMLGDHTHTITYGGKEITTPYKPEDTVIRKLKCQSCGYEESDLTKGRCQSCGDHLYLKDMIEIPKFDTDDYVEITAIGDSEPSYIKVRNFRPGEKPTIFKLPKK
jgi:hypothetical protein